MFECEGCGKPYDSALAARKCAEYDDLESD